MKTYRQVIKDAEASVDSHQKNVNEVKLLMLELTREHDIDLYSSYEEEVDTKVLTHFNDGVNRLIEDEPLAYILGYSWFYGYKIKVNQGVLIPRDETEELVANILGDIDEYFSSEPHPVVIDVGTGSGAIALSLKGEEDRLLVYASDISEEAVQVAKENALINEVELNFLTGNMLDPYISLGLKVDVLVCNPPYIPDSEVIENSVKDYEPHLALFGGEDGLRYYREVFTKSPLILKENSLLAFEIGYDQREVLTKEAQLAFPNAKVEVLKDLNGKDRMLFIYNGIR